MYREFARPLNALGTLVSSTGWLLRLGRTSLEIFPPWLTCLLCTKHGRWLLPLVISSVGHVRKHCGVWKVNTGTVDSTWGNAQKGHTYLVSSSPLTMYSWELEMINGDVEPWDVETGIQSSGRWRRSNKDKLLIFPGTNILCTPTCQQRSNTKPVSMKTLAVMRRR